jgi:hypothetical protein
MKSRSSWKQLIGSATALGLSACLSPPVEAPRTLVTQETDVRVEQNIKNKVDILFMVDNSPSMTPKQNELKNRFPSLIKKLDDFATKGNPAWYHIGVVTSDLGSGQFTLGSGAQCHPGGDGGKLQAKGAAADVSCGKLGNNLNFIDYNQLNNTNNLPAGQDLPKTFTCMASVGAMGCGFEHQLESVYRALHDPIAENQGFLRADAILAVVFVTDEDDCSADPNTDLFDPSKTATYGINHSYRCTRFGLTCNGGMPPDADSGGPLSMCVSASPAAGGKLIDIQKYINYFTLPSAAGGVKLDPNDVILATISAPPDPVASKLTTPCADASAPSCVILSHSCSAPQPVDAMGNPLFFGDPAVRISTVINSAKSGHKQETSICDTDYTTAIEGIGDIIVSQIGKGCVDSYIVDRADGTGPDCVVEDVTTNMDGSTTIKSVPSCTANNNMTPCWKVEQKPDCPVITNPADPSKSEQIGITVDRGGQMAPPGTTARVSCSTIAHAT